MNPMQNNEIVEIFTPTLQYSCEIPNPQPPPPPVFYGIATLLLCFCSFISYVTHSLWFPTCYLNLYFPAIICTFRKFLLFLLPFDYNSYRIIPSKYPISFSCTMPQKLKSGLITLCLSNDPAARLSIYL